MHVSYCISYNCVGSFLSTGELDESGCICLFVHSKVNTANNNHACVCVVVHITIALTLLKNATSLRGEVLMMQQLNALSTRRLRAATLSHMH